MTKKLLIAIITAFMVFMPVYSRADWVSDWFTQATGTGPGYFQGRSQNYYYGGSFSARYNPTTTNLVNISLPSLNVGCGGIDLFGGGFGFVNLQYLVQQLQQIIQMAPAMAFNLAIEAVSEALHVNMNTIKNLIDRLNGLNLNACKASKALVAFTASSLGAPTPGEYGNAVADFTQSSGLSDLYDSVKDIFSSNGGNATASANSLTGGTISSGSTNMISGCPTLLKNIFNNGSFLNYEESTGILSSEYIDLIRALIGDVYAKQDPNSGIPVVSFIPPAQCSQNGLGTTTDIDNFLKGTYWTEQVSSNGQPSCSPQTITINGQTGLTAYVQNEMSKISSNIQTKSTLTSDEIGFLNNVPFNVAKMLVYNTVTGNQQAFIAGSADYIAKAFAYQTVYNLYQAANTLISQLQAIQQSTNSGQSGGQCDVQIMNTAFSNIETMRNNLWHLYQDAYNVFAKSGAEYQTVVEFNKAQENFQDQVVNLSKSIFNFKS